MAIAAIAAIVGIAAAVLLTGCQTTSTPAVSGSDATMATTATPATNTPAGTAVTTTVALPGGRTGALRGLGGARSQPLIDRIAADLPGAVDAVTAFWGTDWPGQIVVVVTESDEQFRVLAHGSADIAAATTADGMVFAPGAADMGATALGIVVRHELFHYAARAQTVADAPLWLTEGVADYVGRPAQPPPPDGARLAQLPTDADLQTAGPARSDAYDRAWWFSRFVAERYGAPALKALYLRACGAGHPDPATAVRETLGTDLDEVVAQWRAWMTR
ncbi:peptidase [Mycolicibacterium neoaurum]|uniref:peptidase n=2 Tax=Mycolicibacterium neoaurum TaxID=1795 RepID=UPI00248CFFB9|nr:peptidase [Mycolicibacterium neoaurum]WBP93808.1 peptidase [Mycolicibacterium neoaurum]WBS07601.1 peptidase [Mycolicibacterium neoaurum]